MLKRSVGFVCIALMLVVPAAFSQIDEQVNVGIIEIWVKATDGNHHFVDDLGPKDFSVFIDGKKMDLRCFDRTFDTVAAPAGTSQQQSQEQDLEQEPANRQKRTFIFFFDLLHSSARDVDFLKNRIVSFLQTSFHEGDEGIVFALLPSVNLGVAQKMTGDKDALIRVVQKVNGNSALEKRVRSNEKELLEVLYAFNANTNAGSGDRAGASSRAPETILQARGLARTFAAQERNLSKITLNSFLTIADYLSGTEYTGRPVMIYVSGGFSLRPGQNYYSMVQRAIEDQYVRGTEDMMYWEYPPDNDFENEVKRAIGLLNRLNITIYSVDANGLEGFDRTAELNNQQANYGPNHVEYTQELQDSLAIVSEETGGLAFLNSQNFERSLAEITSDMGQQYWLCAGLPDAKKRGTYHKIELKVDRKDVDLRYRQGYVD